ncbi:Polyferredoxin [Halanaeroarchaeum sp. HSR-CO]|uniref:4Fe-4S binding protein n=1 Tax=Halanaeroarchaeum sp. HSR-CO TaxID=2866382 RepID=UPI00217EA703|nr:4Fe-4S binding protein [Halanaeroarchaeum sp. HSR-CO]UWG46717.1 Polyferredoxin [Halanaeroarchaeum sp. HSR-CO]
MSHVVAVVSDCRGTAAIDREAVAGALTAAETVTTPSLSAHAADLRDRVLDADPDAVLLIAGDDPIRESFRAALEDADIQTATISPYLGAGQQEPQATAIVAGAGNAELAAMPDRADFVHETADERDDVVVVGDPTAATDLAAVADVTLLADGRELSAASMPNDVAVRPGTVVDVTQAESGYELTVSSRVTPDCTGCGRCLRQYPEATTNVPVAVETDEPIGGVCPVDAIRPADDPYTDTLAADQIVWPEYDGDLADTIWMHTESAGVTAAVREAADRRHAEPVTVDAETCAVGRNGQAGCSACEAACPNDAIEVSIAGDGGVRIRPDRCVACGTCVSVCPTDSIEPTRTFDVATHARMVRDAVGPLLETHEIGGGLLSRGTEPVPFAVAFVSDGVRPAFEAALTGRPTPPVIPITVPNVLAVPDAVAEYVVALGADGVLLASDPERPLDPVTETARSANRALADIGVGERVHVADTASPAGLAETLSTMLPSDAREAAETGAVSLDSRHALGRDATVAMVADQGGGTVTVTAPGVGEVAVEESACTLCDTCDNLCPTGALTQSDGTLSFDPAACVGCGLCETGCPEDAITVTETITVEAGSLGDTRTVVEQDRVECRVCGEPFASQSGLDAMRDRLDDASLEALDLEVCPSCRTMEGRPTDGRIPR